MEGETNFYVLSMAPAFPNSSFLCCVRMCCEGCSTSVVAINIGKKYNKVVEDRRVWRAKLRDRQTEITISPLLVLGNGYSEC